MKKAIGVVFLYSILWNFFATSFHCPAAVLSRATRTLPPRSNKSRLRIAVNSQGTETLSHILEIRCENFAGVSGKDGGDDDDESLTLQFESQDNHSKSHLVAVTGETGHGKSLLISKVVDLVTGGKASSSMIQNSKNSPPTSVEVHLRLCCPELVEMVQTSLQAYGVEPYSILKVEQGIFPIDLSLKRVLVLSSKSNAQRLKSICFLNGEQVTLKVLRGIGAPLLPVVNAPVAANALGRQESRLAMIDAGVSPSLLQNVDTLSATYRRRRNQRQRLEREIASRTLPVSMSDEGDKDTEILQHWIDELDLFEKRILGFTSSLGSRIADPNSQLGQLLDLMGTIKWTDSDDSSTGISSTLYRHLLDLDLQVKALDKKIVSAAAASEAIVSLSSPSSARTAVERARDLLLEVGGASATDQSRLMSSTEKAHDFLNQLESLLNDCEEFFEDEDKGILAVVQHERNSCPVSSERLGEYILEWNTLARKHGISPYLLPTCHKTLREELSGNVEAKTLLPKAMKAEKDALSELMEDCKLLSKERGDVAARLSIAVSKRLPSLGMDSKFFVQVKQPDKPKYGSGYGIDEIDFFLFHHSSDVSDRALSPERGGKLELVASSGERARILLAMECVVPGSVQALCGAAPIQSDNHSPITRRPVAVIYDEIDAHVGGRASVAVAKMLSEQSNAHQVFSITHSPAVAASADVHIRVRKSRKGDRTIISADSVIGSDRVKELARMASGDMAMEEAEAFAIALIRDAGKQGKLRN